MKLGLGLYRHMLTADNSRLAEMAEGDIHQVIDEYSRTGRIACAAPWHAGMAFALGYIRGILNSI